MQSSSCTSGIRMNPNLRLNVKTTSLPSQGSNLTTQSGKSKLLGLRWDKTEDTLSVTFPTSPAEITKHGILANLAQVYDPLGVVSPVMLDGKGADSGNSTPYLW